MILTSSLAQSNNNLTISIFPLSTAICKAAFSFKYCYLISLQKTYYFNIIKKLNIENIIKNQFILNIIKII